MRVLQIIPSLEAGGAERAVLDVAAGLQAAGHQAYVISSGGPMVSELERSGARHAQWNVASKNPLHILANARRLQGFIRDHGIELVHARSRAPAWSAWLAAKKAGIPFVTTFHAAYKGSSPWKKAYNGVMARGDAIIAISGFIASHIEKHYGAAARGRVTVIPRGIDFSVYDVAAVSAGRKDSFSAEHGGLPGTPLLILPGRLSPIKGQELAIAALAQLRDMDFLCLIIGPDQGRTAYRHKLQAQINAAGLADKVRLVAKTDLVAAYALASLVLSPSQVAEGFGRVPVEAQAFGVPVVATALGATSETVREGETGWLVPPGDADALARAIRHALTLSAGQRQHMGQAAIRHVRAHFGLEQMVAATLRVYESLLHRKPHDR